MKAALVHSTSLLFGILILAPITQADPVRDLAVVRQVQVDAAEEQLDDKKASTKKAKDDVAAAWKKLAERTGPDYAKLETARLAEPATPRASEVTFVCAELPPDECKQRLEASKKSGNDLAKLLEENKLAEVEAARGKLTKPTEAMGIADGALLRLCGLPNDLQTAPATPASVSAWFDACTKGLDTEVAKIKAAEEALPKAEAEQAKAQKLFDERTAALKSVLSLEITSSTPAAGSKLRDRLSGVRRVRCYTAYCWGGYDGMQYGIEPIIDLPIGISWAVGNGALANYINANRLDVTVSAGIRYWFAYDVASVGLLIARPSLSSSTKIHLEHSDKTFTDASISRPFPTVVLGLWGDIFAITASYDQLRNTDGTGPVDPNFLPNEVLSRAIVFGVSINTLTAARNAIGASSVASEKEDE